MHRESKGIITCYSKATSTIPSSSCSPSESVGGHLLNSAKDLRLNVLGCTYDQSLFEQMYRKCWGNMLDVIGTYKWEWLQCCHFVNLEQLQIRMLGDGKFRLYCVLELENGYRIFLITKKRPDRHFHNFVASESVTRRSWTTYNLSISWPRGSKNSERAGQVDEVKVQNHRQL